MSDFVNETLSSEYLSIRTWVTYVRHIRIFKQCIKDISLYILLYRLRKEGETGENLSISHLKCLVFQRSDPEELRFMLHTTNYSIKSNQYHPVTCLFCFSCYRSSSYFRYLTQVKVRDHRHSSRGVKQWISNILCLFDFYTTDKSRHWAENAKKQRSNFALKCKERLSLRILLFDHLLPFSADPFQGRHNWETS